MKVRLTTIFLILILIGGLFSCREKTPDQEEILEQEETPKNVGGVCIHENNPITITVREIKKLRQQENKNISDNSEIWFIGYEITYEKVSRNGDIKGGEVGVKSVEAKAKGVKLGKKFSASITQLVSGTCNPRPIYPAFRDWK